MPNQTNPVVNALRLQPKQVQSQSLQFNGNIELQLLPDDPDELTFYVNVKAFTGDNATPSYSFTPATDKGEARLFRSVDDVFKWLNQAYFDITNVKLEIVDYTILAKEFVPPTDAVKEATKQKAAYGKLVTKADGYLTVAAAEVTSDETSGWNLSTAHPALQANWLEDKAKRDAVAAAKAWYANRVAHFNAIINPVAP